jgi:hypothetical protein
MAKLKEEVEAKKRRAHFPIRVFNCTAFVPTMIETHTTLEYHGH